MTRHDAERKQKILEHIARTVADRGYPPSVREIADAVGLASTSAVHHHLIALEREGMLERGQNSSRAVRLTPQGEAELDRAPRRIPIGVGRVTPFRMPLERDVLALPVLGEIAAGQPIEAIRDNATVDVPASMLGRGEHFALQVAGDSMIEAGILDGDTVIVQRGDTAENGTIVVALVDENEVTLKRLRRRGASVALEPANPSYESRIFGPNQVKVQGKLVGLLRRY